VTEVRAPRKRIYVDPDSLMLPRGENRIASDLASSGLYWRRSQTCRKKIVGNHDFRGITPRRANEGWPDFVAFDWSGMIGIEVKSCDHYDFPASLLSAAQRERLTCLQDDGWLVLIAIFMPCVSAITSLDAVLGWSGITNIGTMLPSLHMIGRDAGWVNEIRVIGQVSPARCPWVSAAGRSWLAEHGGEP